MLHRVLTDFNLNHLNTVVWLTAYLYDLSFIFFSLHDLLRLKVLFLPNGSDFFSIFTIYTYSMHYSSKSFILFHAMTAEYCKSIPSAEDLGLYSIVAFNIYFWSTIAAHFWFQTRWCVSCLVWKLFIAGAHNDPSASKLYANTKRFP